MKRGGVITVAVLVLLAAAGSPADAADWDHDANIDSAVVELVKAYGDAGMTGVERLVEDCYRQVDAEEDADDRLRQFEYCAGMDLAAVRLDRREAAGSGSYFGMDAVVGRVGRLSTFLDDPNVGNQVIRAWSRSADEALARHAD